MEILNINSRIWHLQSQTVYSSVWHWFVSYCFRSNLNWYHCVFHLISIHVLFSSYSVHNSMRYNLIAKWNFVWQQTIFTCDWIVSVLPTYQFRVLLWIECILMVELRSNLWIWLKFCQVTIIPFVVNQMNAEIYW